MTKGAAPARARNRSGARGPCKDDGEGPRRSLGRTGQRSRRRDEERRRRERSEDAGSGARRATRDMGNVPQKPSQGAVTGALGAVLPRARACLGPDDPISRATVVFSSGGSVQSVSVSGAAARQARRGVHQGRAHERQSSSRSPSRATRRTSPSATTDSRAVFVRPNKKRRGHTGASLLAFHAIRIPALGREPSQGQNAASQGAIEP